MLNKKFLGACVFNLIGTILLILVGLYTLNDVFGYTMLVIGSLCVVNWIRKGISREAFIQDVMIQ